MDGSSSHFFLDFHLQYVARYSIASFYINRTVSVLTFKFILL